MLNVWKFPGGSTADLPYISAVKAAIAQFRSRPGDLSANLDNHLLYIRSAASGGAEVLFFPELSLTGYEPRLAGELALLPNDPRLEPVQAVCEELGITVGLGAPLKTSTGVNIALFIYRPGNEPLIYAKQLLHEDELPYFLPGKEQLILEVGGERLAPAICYESLQPVHGANCLRLGATVYLATVAKSLAGIAKANDYFPRLASESGMAVLMGNAVGPSDDFTSGGHSAVWNSRGELMGQLDRSFEGILVYDTRLEWVSILGV